MRSGRQSLWKVREDGREGRREGGRDEGARGREGAAKGTHGLGQGYGQAQGKERPSDGEIQGMRELSGSQSGRSPLTKLSKAWMEHWYRSFLRFVLG